MAQFAADMDRDVQLLDAYIRGGLDALVAASMYVPEFASGPDAVLAYCDWMAAPEQRDYREQVAEKWKGFRS